MLFGDRREAPSVDEQVASYLAIAAALGGRPITIRTWDVGGDKPLASLPQAREANPFLGERGLRVFRRRPELPPRGSVAGARPDSRSRADGVRGRSVAAVGGAWSATRSPVPHREGGTG